MNFITTGHDHVLDLLEDILNKDPPVPTDLIVCSTREEFLDQILSRLDHRNAEQTVPPISSGPEGGGEDTNETDVAGGSSSSSKSVSEILSPPTLRLLYSSEFVHVIFCPAIMVLRGYLSGYVPKGLPSSSISPASVPQFPGQITVLNLLALHHGSSEFTVQGLSQTLANAVSAAHRTRRVLRLVECKDATDLSHRSHGSALWQAEVPLLSGSIKIGPEGASWGRRTISVERVASRWFRHEKDSRAGKQREPSDSLCCSRRVVSNDDMLV